MGQTISQFTRSATTALGRAVLEAATEANIGPGKGDWSNSSMREHPLNPEQKAAVARLESSGMYCSDQEMLLAVADESMNSADRRLVERVLKAAHHRPVRDMRPPVPPDLLERITKAAAAVEARRLETEAELNGGLVRAQLAVRVAETPEEMERRRAGLRAAEERYRVAREAQERATVALNDLYCEQAERWREALLAESIK